MEQSNGVLLKEMAACLRCPSVEFSQHLPESGECLFVVVRSWTDGGYHDSLAVPPKVVLEQPSECGVTIGDV